MGRMFNAGAVQQLCCDRGFSGQEPSGERGRPNVRDADSRAASVTDRHVSMLSRRRMQCLRGCLSGDLEASHIADKLVIFGMGMGIYQNFSRRDRVAVLAEPKSRDCCW
jgi:hypothetical protein